MTSLWLLACATAPEPEQPAAPAPTAPDLVLVVLPGLGGSGANQRDLLDGLGRKPDLRYTSAWSQSPKPFPSLASLLIGTYPSAGPVCGLTPRGEREPATRPWCAGLPEGRASLPEALTAYGYRTALVSGGLLGAEELAGDFGERALLESPIDWRALRGAVEGWWSSGGPRLLVLVAGEEDFAATGAELGELLPAFDEAEVWLTSTNGPGYVKRTAEGETLVDDELGLDTLHVPLWAFGVPGGTREEVVELIDLAPTLLARAGAVPAADIAGRDLAATEGAGWAYAELGDQLAVVEEGHLLTWRAWLHSGSALDPTLTERLLEQEVPRGTLRLVGLDGRPSSDEAIRAKLLSRMGAVRTGEAAPAEEARRPDRLLEIRLHRAEGYW